MYARYQLILVQPCVCAALLPRAQPFGTARHVYVLCYTFLFESTIEHHCGHRHCKNGVYIMVRCTDGTTDGKPIWTVGAQECTDGITDGAQTVSQTAYRYGPSVHRRYHSRYTGNAQTVHRKCTDGITDGTPIWTVGTQTDRRRCISVTVHRR